MAHFINDNCLNMRVLAIADDDSIVTRHQACQVDLILSLGDIWDSTIEKAMQIGACSRVLAVRGNHDSAAPFAHYITDLHFTIHREFEVLFGGFAGSWRYKPRGHHLYEQDEVSRKLRDFPRVDVFVAHNSPRGIHERDDHTHQGFDAFTDYIERTQPKYFIHGHQHINQSTRLGETEIIGVFGARELQLDA